MNSLPELALSIRQPWAWLIVHGFKDVENRTWRTNVRGPVLIHAGLKVDLTSYYSLRGGSLKSLFRCEAALPGLYELEQQCGGIVGRAAVVDCVRESASPWFVGDYGFVIEDAQPLDFIPCKGALSFFKPQF